MCHYLFSVFFFLRTHPQGSGGGHHGLFCLGLENFQDALKKYEKIKDQSGITNAILNIGSAYSDLCDYPQALEYDFKALKRYEELGNSYGIAIAANNIGSVYILQGDYPKALEYYFKALKIDEAEGDKGRIAAVTGNIGNVYFSQKDYPKALEYYFKTLKMDEDAGDKEGVARNTGNIALAYASQKNYLLAIENYRKSLQMAEETGYKHSVAWNLEALGEVYLSMAKDISIISDNVPPNSNKANLHTAIDYLQRSLALSKELHIMSVLQDSYQYLAEACKQDGDYRKALDYHENYEAIKDSIFSKENNEKIIQQGMKYEYDKKTAEAKKLAAFKLQQQQSYTYMGIVGILLLTGFSFFIVRERSKSEKERKKSDGLLLNILPAEIAAELKSTGASEAKQFNDVTVLFTDFVCFTETSERLTPKELVRELNNCFKAFDEITGKYNIEKIKTIGDAYLAVAGLPTADPQHAEHVVRAAIEINNFMQDRIAKLVNNTFEIRIGVHSGSVVAGIVGVKKFAYDIWGDTVNTAARMEQNSDAGRVNISETTYELVKDKFTCEYRGEIAAKGKGALKMYYVSESANPSFSA